MSKKDKTKKADKKQAKLNIEVAEAPVAEAVAEAPVAEAVAEAPVAEATTTPTEKEKLEAAKAKAAEKVGEKAKATVETITFRKGSGSGIVFSVLKESPEPITLEKAVEASKEKGLVKNTASRVNTVLRWFANNGIAVFSDSKYALVASKPQAPSTEPATASE